MVMQIAYTVIAAWASWCVMSGSVNDGVIGKLFYSLVAVASFAAVFNNAGTHDRSDEAMIVCFALIGARHFFMKALKQRRGKMPSTNQPDPDKTGEGDQKQK